MRNPVTRAEGRPLGAVNGGGAGESAGARGIGLAARCWIRALHDPLPSRALCRLRKPWRRDPGEAGAHAWAGSNCDRRGDRPAGFGAGRSLCREKNTILEVWGELYRMMTK